MVIDGYLFRLRVLVLFALSGARGDGRMNGSRARGSRDPKKRYDGVGARPRAVWTVWFRIPRTRGLCVCVYESMHRSIFWGGDDAVYRLNARERID